MKYRRVGLALLMAAALGACVFAPQALADSNARIVRLSYVDGQVQIDRRDGRGFEHAFLNMPLAPGTRVTTRDDGRAEIEFEDMSTVRLTPDTLVETQLLDLRSSGGKYTLVDLQEGTAYFNIRRLEDDDDFRVVIGQREFSLTRASRFRLRVDRAQVVLAVFQGEVEITDQSGRLTVRKNETLTLDLSDPSRYYLAKGVDQDRYDDWDRERDEYRDRYANQGSYRGYSSAYSYGVADLNYWGNYTYFAGYGYLWRPHYYGIGWNPYSNGAWYWYPGSGWIWVSAYPWGWMPFRYGNWYYISGHGWGWRPGGHWNRWSPVVAVHNPPAGHVVPTPPPPTGRRDPVVVGRGPTTILPPQDLGPGHRRDSDGLVRRGGNPASASGSGVVATPGAASGGAPTAGSGVTATPGAGSGGAPSGGSGVPAGSGGSGRPAVDSRGSRGSGPVREVELEDAIRNARERRSGGGQAGGGQAGGVITNSGPGSSAPSSGSASAGGSGAASQDSARTSGRERVPEPRRQLPDSMTRDSATPSTSGSSGGARSGYSGGSSGSGAPSASADRSPYTSGGRPSEPRGEAPRGYYMEGSGSSGSASSGSSRAGSGSSGGSSGGSSYSSGSGSSGGHSSAGSSGSSSGGRGSGGGSASGAGRSSGGGHSSSSGGSSSSGARSSATANPK